MTSNDDSESGNESDVSRLQGLKDNSLKTAGYGYLVGDAALFASGLMAGRPKEAMSGLLYTVGGLACARYANPSADKQLSQLSHRLGKYFQEQNVTIPDSPDTKQLMEPGGMIDHVESFMYKYPSQILNATYAVGGLQLMRSGMQYGKHWDTASGALVAAGGIAGLLLKEKKADPDHVPHGIIEKTQAWMQEKPLRVSGALYALNNVTLIMSALAERKANPAQKSYMFKFLTAASYIFANTMLSMSSKDNHGKSDASTHALEQLSDTAAKVIAAQPPELQEALVQHVAGFLSSQPEVHFKAEELAAMLTDRLRGVAVKFAPGSWQHKLYDHNGAPIGPTL